MPIFFCCKEETADGVWWGLPSTIYTIAKRENEAWMG
jgi:hypothetical protein